MENVTVAITNNHGTNNINILPPQFVGDGINIKIHYNPIINLATQQANFDILIDFTLDGQKSEFEILKELSSKIPYYEIKRESKITQMVKINNVINRLPVPKSNSKPLKLVRFSKVIGNSISSMPLSEFPSLHTRNNDWLVVKIDNGARGLGQAVVNKINLNSFLSECKELDKLSELKTKFPSVKFGNTEGDDDTNYFKTFPLVVCQYIPNIEKEYRILVNGKEIFGYERILNNNSDYKQANLDKNKPIDYSFTPVRLSKLISDKHTYMLIKSAISNLGIDFGSVDLFKTADGQYGIFEYSPQFGMHEIDPDFLEKFHRDFIVRIIEDSVNNLV